MKHFDEKAAREMRVKAYQERERKRLEVRLEQTSLEARLPNKPAFKSIKKMRKKNDDDDDYDCHNYRRNLQGKQSSTLKYYDR